ncbi:trypsin-1-like [Planococcus citri]|uniref:trypsin-1-like n=1 Tax=Planococcus citri TaxID=170843 RepID=UPI0031F732DD
MFLASAIVFVNVITIQLLQITTAEGLHINRRFPATDILHTPQRSMGTVVSKCPECDCRTNTRKKRIAGGTIAEENEFPWMAALKLTYRDRSTSFCGATIITKQHVLTAAHCVDGYTAGQPIEAALGRHYQKQRYERNEKIVGIKEIIRHPGFDFKSRSGNNDIAILKLNRTISFNIPQIQPACLPSSENEDYVDNFGTVIGWGFTGDSISTTNGIRKLEVPIIPTNDCRINYSHRNASFSVTDNMMCAGGIKGQDTCMGDSGGPLQIDLDGLGTMKVVGIVSWGGGCSDEPDYPTVYTRIDRYKHWIHDNIGEECLCEI